MTCVKVLVFIEDGMNLTLSTRMEEIGPKLLGHCRKCGFMRNHELGYESLRSFFVCELIHENCLTVLITDSFLEELKWLSCESYEDFAIKYLNSYITS